MNILKESIDGITMYKDTSTGQLHNPHGPAYISKSNISFTLNGDVHNIVGPANIKMYGFCSRYTYCINGVAECSILKGLEVRMVGCDI